MFVDTSAFYALLVATETEHPQVLAAWRDLEERLLPLTRIEWVARELRRRGLARLRRENRRRRSLVDCVSFEVMRQEGLQEALTLDHHVAEQGIRVLPDPQV